MDNFGLFEVVLVYFNEDFKKTLTDDEIISTHEIIRLEGKVENPPIIILKKGQFYILNSKGQERYDKEKAGFILKLTTSLYNLTKT